MATPGGADARLRRGERFMRADYRRAFAEGKSFPSRSFVGWIVRADGDGPARLGVVVSKRTFPLSVERSRARRLMREAFRQSKGEIAGGVWLLLIGRRRLAKSTSRDVTRELRAFYGRNGILRANAARRGAPEGPTP